MTHIDQLGGIPFVSATFDVSAAGDVVAQARSAHDPNRVYACDMKGYLSPIVAIRVARAAYSTPPPINASPLNDRDLAPG